MRTHADARASQSRALDLLLVVLFLAVIALPLAANLAGDDGADPQAENRELAPMPRFDGSVRSLADFPSGFGKWFEDHFGFRARLVRWYGESRLWCLGVSPSTAVVKGRDGWLFYNDDGGMADYSNEQPLSPGELEAWRATVTRTRDWLKARGIAYVFTIAPDKHVIYPEKVPESIRRVHATSRTDQVLTALRDAGVPVVDPRAALLDARRRERVYFVTDTHWNDRGAFVAYRQIVDAIRAQVPAVPRGWTREDFTATERVTEGMDLAGMIGLTRVLSEVDLGLAPLRQRHARVVEPAGGGPTDEEGRLVTVIPGSTLPRALVFRDSFMSRVVPYLSEHFSRAVYLWQNDFDPDQVRSEKPDVVVQEIVGRHLYTFLPSPELVPAP
ncbi:MAG: alginate O-acetyltransferase AlgX-related protein [Betaproteobacteria bacterium]